MTAVHPASVCYDVLDEADKRGSDLVLIDTAGRLHTSPSSCASSPRWSRDS
ncbi:MAG: hypothetical protein ACLTYW_02155 [Collinsella sp.]